MTALPEVIVGTLCLVIAWTLAFYWLPAMTQIYALTRLHALRDRLYATAERVPGFRDTSLYRDLEFMYTASIFLLRDRSWRDVVDFYITEKNRLPNDQRTQERTAAYLAELNACFGDRYRDEAIAIGRDLQQREIAMVVRLCCGHPAVAALLAIGLVFIIVWVKVFKPAVSLAEAAAAIDRAPQRPAGYDGGDYVAA